MKSTLIVSALPCLTFLSCTQGLLGKNSSCTTQAVVAPQGSTSLTDKNSLEISPIGGFFHYTRFDKDEIFDKDIAKIKASQEERCTAVFLVHKNGEVYNLKMYTHMECIKYYMYYGEKADAEVFIPDDPKPGYLTGKSSIPLRFEDDGKRNKYLAETFGAYSVPARKMILDQSISIERAGGLRRAATDEQKEALCLALPPGSKAPINSDLPNPEGCLWFAQLEIRDFTVPAEYAVAHKSDLDALVNKSSQFELKTDTDPLLSQGLLRLLQKRDLDLQALSALEYENQRISLADLIAESTCAPADGFNVWCGANRGIFLRYLAKYYPPQRSDLFEKAIASDFAEADIAEIKAAWQNAKQASLDQRKILLEETMEINRAIFANKQNLFVASNHLKGATPKPGEVEFKSVQLFNPDDTSKLPDTDVTLANGHLQMSLKNGNLNLGTDPQRGSLITLNGYPILSFSLKVDQSGGASLMPLPTRKSDSEESGSEKNRANNTKKSSRNSDGC